MLKVPAQVQLHKVEDGRAVAAAATHDAVDSFQKCGVPCLRMNILAGCTTMNFLAWYAQRERKLEQKMRFSKLMKVGRSNACDIYASLVDVCS